MKRGLLVFAALGLLGCQSQTPQSLPIYTGPTLSLDQVVAGVNARNIQIPTLWARQDFDGNIVDDKGNSHSISAHGVILYRGPHELRIVADNEFGPIFEMGATDEFYWLKVIPQSDTLWWGKMKNVGKPGAASMPIRPDYVLDVLAVGLIDPELMREPYTIMRFNNDADAYMLDTVVRGPDRMLARKEIWYDRTTLLPGLVLLFDDNGRVLLQAHLENYQPLPIDGVPPDRWPQVASVYKLRFPDTGSTMQFALSQQALTKNGVPRPGGIHLPDLNNPGVKHVIQVDANCDSSPTPPPPSAPPQ
jgi:hypothetical protein